MKQLLMIIFIFLICPISHAVVILPLQINKAVQVNNGEFSEDFLVTTGSDIYIVVPNNVDIPTDNIEITLPDGTIVNSLNAASHGFTFTSHTADHGLKSLVAPFDAWIIDSSNAPLGTYTVSGSSTASHVPVSLRILDSNIHFKLFVGEYKKGIYSGKDIPISLYLNESQTHLTTATVGVNIYKDTTLIDSFIIKDDGSNTDITSGDGHYDLITSFESSGIYKLAVEISGTNSSGMLYEGRIIETISVKDEKLFVDLNYIEHTTDEDNDGYIDELIISFPYTGSFSESDFFYVYGKLNIGNDYVEAHEKILASSGNLLLKFQGKEIREIGYSGTFNLEFVRVDLNGRYLKSFRGLKDTQYYSNEEWERDDLIYIGNFREEPVDEDNNNIYEGLNFIFEVDTIPVGDFGYSIGFYTEDGTDMGLFGNEPVAFTLGTNTIETYLPASRFSSLGVDSKIEAKNLLMYGLNDLGGFLRLKSLGTSRQYSCWDFAGCENGPNTPPDAVNDFSESNGSSIYINAASNDIDVDGDLIKVNSVTQPQNGVAEVVGNSVHYTPNEGFTGEDVFTYEILDVYPFNNVWKRGRDNGTITVSVSSNLSPVANDDTYSIPIGGESQLNVLSNDTDPDGDNLYITEATSPQNGTITNYGNLIVYKANDGFEGQDSFEYTIIDVDPETNVAKDGTDSAFVILNVGAVSNAAPIANDDEFTVTAGVEAILDVVANDSDPDGDNVYVVEYTVPTQGTIEFIDNQAHYTAYPAAAGFDGFKYTITDTKGGYSQADVLITIESDSINNPPVANDDHASTLKNNTVTISVLSNDSDPENDLLSIVSLGSPLNGVASIVNQQVEYTPNTDFTGEDVFSYTISDGNGNSSSANIIVTVNQTNLAPIANDDTAITKKNQPVSIDVLHNDEDPDNDALSIVGVITPNSGTAEISGGNIIYSPNIDYVGEDQFIYTVSDGSAESSANVLVTVEDINVAPVAQDDTGELTQGDSIIIDVLQNDTDENGDVLNIIDVSQPEQGSATIENNRIKYVSTSDYIGQVSFTYTISDGEFTSSASISLTINQNADSVPTVNILEPTNGDVFSESSTVNLIAEAIDDEDGALDSIQWSSNIDGALGTGAALSITLSSGQHVITASVQDSAGNANEASVSISVSEGTGTEYRNDNEYTIPDNKGYGVTSNIIIVDSNVTSEIEVSAVINHESLSDIAVQLISPAGKHYNLSNPGGYNAGAVWKVSFKSETDIQGTWSIKVSDQKISNEGSLISWSIRSE